MSTYTEEVFDNSFYKVKHISGLSASGSTKTSYHSHSKLIFSYYIKGGGSILIEGTRYEISDGDFFVTKPTELFKHNISDDCFHERIVLIVSTQILKNLPDNYSNVFQAFLRRKNGEKNQFPARVVKEYKVDRLFEELLEYLREDSGPSSILAFSRVLEILAVSNKIITKELTPDAGQIKRNSNVDDVLKYLNYNYTKDISITDVASRFNLDRSYLSRLFKEQVGMPMWDYVIMRRIYLFNYLINDSSSIEATAYKVGFKNYSNFYRLYKKYMRMTPMEFKRNIYTQN